jgi:hypothetical protein
MKKDPASTDNNAGTSSHGVGTRLLESPRDLTRDVPRPDTNGYHPASPAETSSANRSLKKQPHAREGQATAFQGSRNLDYNKIIRVHYVKDLMRHLSAIQDHAGTTDASLYALRIFETIRQMEKEMPEDPLMHLIFALSDALVCADRWQTYTAAQYEQARSIVEQAAARDKYEFSHLAASLQHLESAGFVTLPFGMEIDSQDAETP